jgi:hypothetical protein
VLGPAKILTEVLGQAKQLTQVLGQGKWLPKCQVRLNITQVVGEAKQLTQWLDAGSANIMDFGLNQAKFLPKGQVSQSNLPKCLARTKI